MTGHLLVVAHEATRTGSPRVLLDLLRSARSAWAAPVEVRLMAGGPLSADLLALSDPVPPAATPAVVLVNGAAAALELDRFGPEVGRAIYVHEQGEALDVLPSGAVAAMRSADQVCCVSESAAADLAARGVPVDRIVVLPPVVTGGAPPSPSATAAARAACGATGRRLVLGCGEAGWRKGADHFVDVVRRLSSRPDVAFAWVGRRPRAFGRLLDHDLDWAGLGGRCAWVDEVADPGPYLAAADLLLMVSREDPQPLVPLEAALVGTPTVGFAIGGLVDLAAVGAAAIVEYPDAAGLAVTATAVLDDRARSAALVDAAVSRARDRQSIEVVGPRFAALIGALLAEREVVA